VENEGKDETDARKRVKMKKKFKVKVDGKEYVVEVEGMEEVGGSGVGGFPKAEKKTSIKEKEPYGKFESITTGEKSILEAMKMENEIRSPADGTIKEVMVEEGANVSHDEKMIVFE